MSDAEARLTAVLAGDDPAAAARALAAQSPRGLSSAIRDRYSRLPGERAQLVYLLAHLRDDLEFERCTNLLVHIGDPAAVHPLIDMLRPLPDHRVPAFHKVLRVLTGRDPHLLPDHRVLDLHHVLRMLTGRDPLVARDADSIRRAWTSIDLTETPEPRITDVRVIGPGRAMQALDEGGGVVAQVANPRLPYGFRTLQIAGEPVYRMGTDCGTCETWMHSAGWPRDRAATVSATMRRQLAHVDRLTEQLLDDLAPLFSILRTGRQVITLADLDLELVIDSEASWFQKRYHMRVTDHDPEEEDEEEEEEEYDPDPGIAHFQLPDLIPDRDSHPSFGVVLPTQQLDRLDEATVAAHASAIESGHRPAAVLLNWVEGRLVQTEFPEQFLLNVILDGHHKLAAYARLNVPARAVLVSRFADQWGPPDDRTRYLREMTEPFIVR